MKVEELLKREGFNYEEKSYDFIPDENLLDVPSIKEAKIDRIIEKAKEGDVVALFMLNPLIEEIEQFIKKGKIEEQCLVFEKGEVSTNLYGDQNIKKIIKAKGEDVFKEYKEFLGDLYEELKGEVEIAVGEKSLEKDAFYGEEDYFNLAMANIIYVKKGKNLYGWKKVSFKGFDDLLLSIATGRTNFKRFGAVVRENYYPYPDLMINENYMESRLSNKNYYRYEKLRKLRAKLIYFMNFKGKVLEFINKKKKYGRREVVANAMENEIKEKLKENIDYYIENNNLITRINNIIAIKGEEGSIIISKERAGEMYVLKDKYERGDTIIEYIKEGDRLRLKIFEYKKEKEFLMVMEEYLIVRSKNLVLGL